MAFLLFAALFALLAAPALAQQVTWVRQVATWNDDFGYDVATDSTGNVYLAGALEGSLPSQPVTPHTDALLAKFSANGTELWRRTLASDSPDYFYSVATDGQDNIYVAGEAGELAGQTVPNGAVLAKYDASGNLLWVRQFQGDGSYAVALAVAIAPDGDVVIAGFTDGALPGQSSSGGEDMFVLKYSSTGNQVWARQFGTTDNDQANGIATDGAGNIFVAAAIEGNILGGETEAALYKLQPGGSQVWLREYGSDELSNYGNDVVADASGNSYLIATVDEVEFEGGSNAFVRKYDPSGNVLWTDKFGTPPGAGKDDRATSADMDAGGNVYVTGSFAAGSLPGQTSGGDFYVRKYAPNGTVLWTHQFGPILFGFGEGVAAGPAGAVYMTGYSENYPGQPDDGGYEAILVRLTGANEPPPELDYYMYLPMILG